MKKYKFIIDKINLILKFQNDKFYIKYYIHVLKLI